jgi:hypothetical protein
MTKLEFFSTTHRSSIIFICVNLTHQGPRYTLNLNMRKLLISCLTLGNVPEGQNVNQMFYKTCSNGTHFVIVLGK